MEYQQGINTYMKFNPAEQTNKQEDTRMLFNQLKEGMIIRNKYTMTLYAVKKVNQFDADLEIVQINHAATKHIDTRINTEFELWS